MGGTLVQDEEAIKRIEELIVSDRASTMLVSRAQGKGSLAGKSTTVI